MDSVRRKMLLEHNRLLEKCTMFRCMCCGTPKPREDAAGVKVYEPRSALLRKNMKPATYVICRSCDNLPEDEVDAKVLRSFAGTPAIG